MVPLIGLETSWYNISVYDYVAWIDGISPVDS